MMADRAWHTGKEISLAIRTRADPAEAWQAWTDPERLSQWFTDRATGAPEVGTTYTWMFDRFGYEVPYPVAHVVSGQQIVWAGEMPGRGPFALEVRIERDGGDTVVRLINSGFLDGAEWEDEYQGVVSGWQMALGILRHYLEHQFGKPRATFFVMRPAEFDYDSLKPLYRDAAGLARWLSQSGEIGAEGSRYTLHRDGASMSGQVLARTAREVAVSWDEIDGVLQLKAFALGPGRRALCVSGWGWGMSAEAAAEIERSLEASVDRLAGAIADRAL